MDSGASDTMFVSWDAFTNYKSVTPRRGNSAKADNGSFEIVGEGDVVQGKFTICQISETGIRW